MGQSTCGRERNEARRETSPNEYTSATPACRRLLTTCALTSHWPPRRGSWQGLALDLGTTRFRRSVGRLGLMPGRLDWLLSPTAGENREHRSTLERGGSLD